MLPRPDIPRIWTLFFSHSELRNTAWSRALLEKVTVTQQLKAFPSFYWTRRFITVCTRIRQWTLFWERWIQYTRSRNISLWCTLILSSHLHLGLPSGLIISDIPTNILYTFLTAPIRATWPTHFILLNLITLVIFGEEYKFWSSSLFSLLQLPATSSLLGPNSFLSILFSNILNIRSFLRVADQVSHS
jgi:hypothetical protein